ncbi:MAG: hemerythrin domain-containing protein [Kiloniellales bacterium]
MFTLIDVLQREHATMRELLSRVQDQIDSKGATDYDLLREVMQYCEHYPGAYHHPKEDLIYNLLLEEAPDKAAALEDLTAEHMIMASAASDTARVIELAAEGDDAAKESMPQKIASYLRFYRMHMSREEREFFPLALEVLSPEQWLMLESQVVDPTDPLYGEKSAWRLQEMMEQ